MADTLDSLLPSLEERSVHVGPYVRQGKPVSGYDSIRAALAQLIDTSHPRTSLKTGNGVTVHRLSGGRIDVKMPDGGHGGHFSDPRGAGSARGERNRLGVIAQKAHALDQAVGKRDARPPGDKVDAPIRAGTGMPVPVKDQTDGSLRKLAADANASHAGRAEAKAELARRSGSPSHTTGRPRMGRSSPSSGAAGTAAQKKRAGKPSGPPMPSDGGVRRVEYRYPDGQMGSRNVADAAGVESVRKQVEGRGGKVTGVTPIDPAQERKAKRTASDFKAGEHVYLGGFGRVQVEKKNADGTYDVKLASATRESGVTKTSVRRGVTANQLERSPKAEAAANRPGSGVHAARVEKVDDKRYQVFGPDGKKVGEPASYTTALKRKKALQSGDGGGKVAVGDSVDAGPQRGTVTSATGSRITVRLEDGSFRDFTPEQLRAANERQKKVSAKKAGVGDAVVGPARQRAVDDLAGLSLMASKPPDSVKLKKIDPSSVNTLGKPSGVISAYEVRDADGNVIGIVGQWKDPGKVRHITRGGGIEGSAKRWYFSVPGGATTPYKRVRDYGENRKRIDALIGLGRELKKGGPARPPKPR